MEDREISGQDFRETMRHLAGAVSVITVGRGFEATGFTATSVVSLSVVPARVLVCVNVSSASWTLLQSFQEYGINVLREDDQLIANMFAGHSYADGAHKYEGLDCETTSTGVRLLKRSLATIHCKIEETFIRYDHAIIIGRAIFAKINLDAKPLIYWQRNYHSLS